MKTIELVRRWGQAALVAALASAGWSFSEPFAAVPEPANPARHTLRAQAAAALASGTSLSIPCLTPVLQNALRDGHRTSAGVRRAASALVSDGPLEAERRVFLPDGTIVRSGLDTDRFDRSGENRDGLFEPIEAVARGLAEAKDLLVRGLDLPSPGPVEVLLADLGGTVRGYFSPKRRNDRRPLIVLDPAGGARQLRRAAIHEYAHAVSAAVGPAGVPPAWSEALATWAELRLGAAGEADLLSLISRRFAELSSGLLAEDLELAAGNAAWFAFLESSYGSATVKTTIEELAAGGPIGAALDRGVRRGGGEDLASAFRNFHLWSVLTGPRADRRHFGFAPLLAAPRFSSTFQGLPALAIQPDPPVEPLGAVHSLLVPEEETGGLVVRFEGETPGGWQADLLLVLDDGQRRRVGLEIGPDGRGKLVVPLDGLAEAILLVRNLDESGGPRRYSWAADRDAGYPFELASFEAIPLEGARGVLLRWETSSEAGLVGFNLMRAEGSATEEVRINPVWIPAFGSPTTPAFYQFLDETARPGVSYRYRVEGVTLEGLSSHSDPVVIEAQAR